jgi:hypothetical protein
VIILLFGHLELEMADLEHFLRETPCPLGVKVTSLTPKGPNVRTADKPVLVSVT